MSETEMRTTGEAIVDGLLAHGVDRVFGIPGVQTYALYEALAAQTENITVYGPRHEQTAAYMAFGYAQVLNDQQRLYGRTIGSKLQNPSFVDIARAFGAEGTHVSDPSQLERVVADAINANEPSVIEVALPLDASASPWRFLMPASRR